MNNFKIIIPVYNSEKWITKCLESVINQTYENWNVVIINDSSSDKTLDRIKEYLKDLKDEEQYKKKKIKLYDRTMNVGALENIIFGINNISNNDEDIIVLIDGDDWLASNDVLEYLNNIYNNPNIWLTYGRLQYVNAKILTPVVKINNTQNYRKEAFNTSHLRTFKYKIWKRINDIDFRDKYGHYYSMAWDLSIMFPLIEMAGKDRIMAIEKLLYFYNDDNPINDFKKNGMLQLILDKEIRNKSNYREIT